MIKNFLYFDASILVFIKAAGDKITIGKGPLCVNLGCRSVLIDDGIDEAELS